MGKRADKVKADFGDQTKLICYANLGITAACLFDYIVADHRWALETLALAVLGINGFALWAHRHALNEAMHRDQLEETAERQSEAAREARMRENGFL